MKTIIRITIAFNILVMIACGDDPIIECNSILHPSQLSHIPTNDMSLPPGPRTLASNLVFSDTIEGHVDSAEGPIRYDGQNNTILEVQFILTDKDSNIKIFYDSPNSTITRVEFNFDSNTIDPFYCVSDGCAGVTFDPAIINRINLDHVVLTKDNSLETETISGAFTQEFLEQMPIAYGGC